MRFTIGKLAKMSNTTTQTLRHYDKLGLLRPNYVDEENGYRYYSLDQLDQLMTIKFLQLLGMSLRDIEDFLHFDDSVEMLDILKKYEGIAKLKVMEFTKIQTKLSRKIELISEHIEFEKLENVVIKEIPERYIAETRFENVTSLKGEFGICFIELYTRIADYPYVIEGDVGVTVPKNCLESRDFDQYNSIFLSVDKEYSFTQKIEACLYAVKRHFGPYENLDATYESLLDFIHTSGYLIKGDSIEIGLLDVSVVTKEEDFITEVQIPIKKA